MMRPLRLKSGTLRDTPGIDDAEFNPEGDICLLEKLLNDDPSSPLPPNELNFKELKTIKSSIDDPPELELKDLPSHLEYAFLEGTDKLPVIISKELKCDLYNTLVEYMILSGADNRPPILDKDLYNSWKSRMELYMQNREHGRIILESVEHGPLIWPTVGDNKVIRTKKYAELSAAEKIQVDFARDLWERVQLLMQGTSLTKQERECKLYDAFDKFTHIKGKFVTDVKLVKDFQTSNFDQLHAYLEQHELHANEVHDPIACLNKAMAFLTAVASSRFPTTNNQLRTSSNPKNQATIQDGRATVQQVQGRQGQNYSGEGHMARQCTQPKRPMNAAWYKEKAMLAEAQEAGQILDEEQLAFLANPGIPASQVQTVIPHNAAFQTEDPDTYDSDCDDLSTAQAVLMANISNYGSDIVSKVPNSKTYLNDMDNQSVHALQDFKQSPVMDFTDNEISSDSNIIPYSQYLQEPQ
ncbi:hypothetical protein Tco_0123524 [Tanacetum coccineum]